MFLGLMLLILIVYIFWASVVKLFELCCKACNERVGEMISERKLQEDSFEHDLYNCISFRSLLAELQSAINLRK